MGNKQSESSTVSSIWINPLYVACRDGDEEQVRNLLPKYSREDLNQQVYPYGGNTCLHIAAANGHDNIVKLLLKQGCYRSASLNSEHQSAYDLAACTKESTRVLFLRQDGSNPTLKSSSRFYEQNATECFDIVKIEDDRDDRDDRENSFPNERRPTIQTYKTEEEKQHELEYSASSKAMCQSRFGRFCVNHLHSDEPLDHHTIIRRLTHILEQSPIHNSDDDTKIDDLMKQYRKNYHSIEQLLHLYTLETTFYTLLKQDSLPLAIPLYMNLQKLKERFFHGRVYRGMHMSYKQLLIYQIAMETPGTLLQTKSFTSTSMDQRIVEEFAYLKPEKNLSVLLIIDFPNVCDQAINLSRISIDTPCLSEYESEEEVLILPWTLFEVTRIKKATDEDDSYMIYLTNVIIPNKSLLSTFKWTCTDLKHQLMRDKKIRFHSAFQKYKKNSF